MKIAILFLLVIGTAFADTGYKMYYYTYTTKTHKCAVDIYVPERGAVKVEKMCFLIK